MSNPVSNVGIRTIFTDFSDSQNPFLLPAWVDTPEVHLRTTLETRILPIVNHGHSVDWIMDVPVGRIVSLGVQVLPLDNWTGLDQAQRDAFTEVIPEFLALNPKNRCTIYGGFYCTHDGGLPATLRLTTNPADVQELYTDNWLPYIQLGCDIGMDNSADHSSAVPGIVGADLQANALTWQVFVNNLHPTVRMFFEAWLYDTVFTIPTTINKARHQLALLEWTRFVFQQAALAGTLDQWFFIGTNFGNRVIWLDFLPPSEPPVTMTELISLRQRGFWFASGLQQYDIMALQANLIPVVGTVRDTIGGVIPRDEPVDEFPEEGGGNLDPPEVIPGLDTDSGPGAGEAGTLGDGQPLVFPISIKSELYREVVLGMFVEAIDTPLEIKTLRKLPKRLGDMKDIVDTIKSSLGTTFVSRKAIRKYSQRAMRDGYV